MENEENLSVDVVLGSRREAFHLAPVIHEFKERTRARIRLISIHSGLEDFTDALYDLSLQPDVQWKIRGAEYNSGTFLSEIPVLFSELWSSDSTHWLLSFGHSELIFSAAVAAFQNQIPIAHIEDLFDSLKDRNLNRHVFQSHRSISILSDLHFTSTSYAKNLLIHSGVGEEFIYSVGSTLTDAGQRILGQIAAEGAIQNLFSDLSVLQMNNILNSQFILIDFRHLKNLNLITDVFQIILQNQSEYVPFLVSNDKSIFRLAAERKTLRDKLLAQPFSHIQRCALILKAACVLTDNEETLEECEAFRTKGILLSDKIDRFDLFGSGSSSLGSLQTDRLQRQIDSSLREKQCLLAQIEKEKHSTEKNVSASAKIVQAITSRTNGIVRKVKTELLSQQAG